MRIRLSAEQRKALILDAGVEELREQNNEPLMLTMQGVADKCSVPTSRATVKRYFETNDRLRAAIDAHMNGG